MTIKAKMQMRIKRSKRYVFMRDDFNDIANYDQIGRVLRNLVQEGELIKVGYGIYTKARKNQITGKVMPACPEGADAVILEALKRLDVQVTLGEATEKYLSGQSTQIPAFTQIKTPRRFTRQLSVGRSQLMPDIKNLFADVADALGIGATSIVEKDYYVVELLRLLESLEFETHDLVFAGGTSLAKANIRLNRMSEDVDIKIVPKPDIALSRSKAKVVRKQLLHQVQDKISQSDFFKIEEEPVVWDEYRYMELLIRYPQHFNQAPCLRPFIKLELVETDLLEPFESRSITSFVYDLAKEGKPVDAFPSVTIVSTSIEKLIAILRRTAAFARNAERADDESLVRHVYDYFKITYGKRQDFVYLGHLATKVIKTDIERYGRQHTLMVEDPIAELLFGLNELSRNPLYKARFNNFVVPMVFGDEQITWQQAYSHFQDSAQQIFANLKL